MEFLYLIPIALALGAIGLAAFMWCLRSGQYEDLDGAAERILFDDEDTPAPPRARMGRDDLKVLPVLPAESTVEPSSSQKAR